MSAATCVVEVILTRPSAAHSDSYPSFVLLFRNPRMSLACRGKPLCLRSLHIEPERAREQITDAGRLRVIFPTPNWGDFVELAYREIRLYGAENFQIARDNRQPIGNPA
jgi:hypothetical protein